MAPHSQTFQTLTTMNTKTTFQTRMVGLLVAAGLFSGCGDGRPTHKVIEGKEPMVVYAVRVHDGHWSSQANREYWVTDASGKGWTYVTSTDLAIGDTVRFSPCR
jgi:hypothetical protein